MNKKSASASVVALCLLLAAAGIVGEGTFRWILFSIAALVAIALAIKVYKKE